MNTKTPHPQPSNAEIARILQRCWDAAVRKDPMMGAHAFTHITMRRAREIIAAGINDGLPDEAICRQVIEHLTGKISQIV